MVFVNLWFHHTGFNLKSKAQILFERKLDVLMSGDFF